MPVAVAVFIEARTRSHDQINALKAAGKVINMVMPEESGNNENLAINLIGKDLTIGFNAKYIIDSLRAVSDSFVKMKFNNSTAPGIIVPTAEEEYLYLILPIRIQG